MNAVVIIAYDSLVPTDQLIIDAMIATIAGKDRQIKHLTKHIGDSLDKDKDDDAVDV